MTITAQIETARAVAKLFALPVAVRGGVRESIEADVLELLATVQAKLSGGVLNARSGNLRESIRSEVDEDGSALTARVFSDGSVPYARIQEFGGRVELPETAPVQAQALAFSYEGKLVFAKRSAAHAVTIPERSYLRSSLDECAAGFVDRIRKVVSEACT